MRLRLLEMSEAPTWPPKYKLDNDDTNQHVMDVEKSYETLTIHTQRTTDN